MKVVIQRVSEAKVEIDNKEVAAISNGYLLLLGINAEDIEEDVDWLVPKIVKLRIFSDEQGMMNKNIQEIDGNIIVVSQFTLFASTKKGNRPSFLQSARPDIAIPLYEQFKAKIEKELGKTIQSGIFGADMKVSLTNDGPVTIIIDSKDKI